MGLFKKPINRCKILEPYRVDIDKILLQRNFQYDNFCKKIAETDEYWFYSYNTDFNQMGGYVLRRSKNDPKNIVFFGENHRFTCVYNNELFQIDTNNTLNDSSFFLYSRNVHSGILSRYNWFGKGFVITHGHLFCQDHVNEMYVEDDKLILNVHRRKATYYHCPEEQEANSKYDFDMDYQLIINFENDKFKATALFPKREECEKDASNCMDQNKTNLNKHMQYTGMLYILKQSFNYLKDMQVHSLTDNYSCIKAVINKRPAAIYINTMMYPLNYNQVISEKLNEIETWANDTFSDNIDIYALGIGLINKNAPEAQKGVYNIGEKYSVAVGDFHLVKVAKSAQYGFSKEVPITVSMVSDEYYYLDHLQFKHGKISDCRRIGSLLGCLDNPNIIDKWELSTILDDVFKPVFKYYLYIDSYQSDFMKTMEKGKKKTPIFFEWKD